MKFSHQLTLNSVPEWTDNYLAYSNLKKLIYQLEKQNAQVEYFGGVSDIEQPAPTEEEAAQPLISSTSSLRTSNVFMKALDHELEKIVAFYLKIEKEMFDSVESLKSDIAYVENYEATLGHGHFSMKFPARFDGTVSPNRRNRESHDDLLSTSVPRNQDDGLSSVASQRQKFCRRATDLFVNLNELKDYVNLNHTGFSKILKKYDKITRNETRNAYMTNIVDVSYPFQKQVQENLGSKIHEIENIYAKICTNNDYEAAVSELKSNLREHIAYERNTVWRDMISQERKVSALGVAKAEGEERPKIVRKEMMGMTVLFPRINRQYFMFTLLTVIFIVLSNIKIFETPEQQKCFSILIYASALWATETIPLFVTSMLIPFLVISLRVMKDPITGIALPAHDATKVVFSSMFSPVIMLLLGGFSIAAALSKHHIAKIVATSVLAKAGTKAIWVLLANMFVATFASMWISNVAAPVLCFSLIQPILRTLPPNSSFAQTLILGIALASNIGGMASPISSPQNVIAIENMKPEPTWLQWFWVALPISILSDIIVWLLLLFIYQPHVATPHIYHLRRTDEKFNKTQYFVLFVTGVTILLWCLESKLEFLLGDMGVIAIIPLVVFFGFGILTKEDFNNFLWTVIILAMGGISLGRAVDNSGLLKTIALAIKNLVEGYSVWFVLLVFCTLMLVVATFISHTVAALIVLPVVREVGMSLEDPHPRLLVMGAALMCSGAMGLPISGFPNMNAIAQEDATGTPYLSTLDFVKAGVPGSVAVWGCIMTAGYGLMLVLGY
ncbi:SPX domain-containing protein [Paraphysoderma sedebokerense]|nr:SPX domain-containing protein [Paraphysoderma sedebokerense]